MTQQVPMTFGDRLRQSRLAAAKDNPALYTLAGAAEALDVSAPETVGRWERDEATPSNHSLRRMATIYHAPELLQLYCSVCPIGRGRIEPPATPPISQLALRLHNVSRSLDNDIQSIMEIAEDGVVSDGEMDLLRSVTGDLAHVHQTISSLLLLAEKLQ